MLNAIPLCVALLNAAEILLIYLYSKICDHSLYTQIIIKNIFTFFLFSIRNENAKPINKRKKSNA